LELYGLQVLPDLISTVTDEVPVDAPANCCISLTRHRKGLEDGIYRLAASSQSVHHSARRAIHRRHQLRFLTGLSKQNF
jgi:chromosome condensin MukBEF ATPase and DNA-binding subunit MukB